MSNVQIPKTATAIVFYEQNGPLKVETDHKVVQPNELKPGEALVKVEYTGVCHTDLHAWKGDWPAAPTLPLVGGQEGAGTIVGIAAESSTPPEVGHAVGISTLSSLLPPPKASRS